MTHFCARAVFSFTPSPPLRPSPEPARAPMSLTHAQLAGMKAELIATKSCVRIGSDGKVSIEAGMFSEAYNGAKLRRALACEIFAALPLQQPAGFSLWHDDEYLLRDQPRNALATELFASQCIDGEEMGVRGPVLIVPYEVSRAA